MNQRPVPSAANSIGRTVRITLATLACATAALGFTAACLERPVVKASPVTSNLFVDQIKQTAIDKIDLLFVVDNSVSMSDKQRMMKEAVPTLLRRLISPNCVSKADPANVMSGLQTCPAGFDKEFSPISDIHIGVISSSLGGHGADACTSGKDMDYNPSKNDKGHLLGTTERGLAIPTYNSLGFLAWDLQGKKTPKGEANQDALITNFQSLVVASGEVGCGYEATLESWYRFLVDPEPHDSVSVTNSLTVKAGIDETVLAQRKAFLRADSLLAIIMLTDENDCSIVDEGIGWLVGTTQIAGKNYNMPRPTTACEATPNSPCCRSCANIEGAPPMGCDALGADPSCSVNGAAAPPLAAAQDHPNLRCFNQKRRFGLDLLYPTGRYVLGLRELNLTIPDRSDPTGVKTKVVPNPLYTDLQGNAPFVRGPELVFFAGIVGVPWQDIADDASLASPTDLKYLTAGEISIRGIWDQILGVPSTGLNPTDPFMIETMSPRTGTNPRTGIAISPANSTNPKANPINGHEYNNAEVSDLQYACIFDLPETSKDCLTATSCDCGSPPGPNLTLQTIQAKVVENNSPLCNPPGGGPASTTQYSAKGYPGLRHLEVLKDYGANSIVASICPKVAIAPNAAAKALPSYGYNPAVTAIIDRLKDALGGRCLPRKLKPAADTGQVPCKVIEARKPKAGEACSCPKGRAVEPIGSIPETEKLATAVRVELQKTKSCDATDETCGNFCLCEIDQLAGNQGCEFAETPPAGLAGYCYIDEAQKIGSKDLLTACPPAQKRKLRFVGENVPVSGAVTFIACAGASAADSDVMTVAPAAP